jgi:hypothetical protein
MPWIYRVQPGTLLLSVRQFVLRRIHEEGGCICPCCRQHCEEYEFALTRLMARSLRQLYNLGGTGHIGQWLLGRSGGFLPNVLKHHRLITSVENPDGNGPFNRSGIYSLTEKARIWLTNPRARISQKVYVFNNRVLRRSATRVTFRQVLREPNWSPEDVRQDTYPEGSE